jgi:hypothetical protein
LAGVADVADRRDELGVARTATVSRLHRLLLELIPGGAKQFLSVTQAASSSPPFGRATAARRAQPAKSHLKVIRHDRLVGEIHEYNQVA